MPHRVNRWNFTDRGSATVQDDTYRGKQNATYTVSSMRQNQGFASVISTFPQGAFMTCRYPVLPEQQRTPAENTWHPQFVQAANQTNQYAEAAACASAAGPPSEPALHNITGTKPLPVPFSQRAGYEEEEARKAAEGRAAFEAFKAHRISTEGGDKIPDDFYEHTQYSATHVQSQLKHGEIYRKSKPRVGTTPQERAMASLKLAQAQEHIAFAAADEERVIQQAERRMSQLREQQQAQQQGDAYRQVEMDPRRTPQGAPTHYNVPQRAPHPSQY